MDDAQKEKKRLEELLADTGDQIDKRIRFASDDSTQIQETKSEMMRPATIFLGIWRRGEGQF